MYCVIQKLKVKSPSTISFIKDIHVVTHDNEEVTTYGYETVEEELKSYTRYKISLHESYREDGVIKKRQYYIITEDALDLAYYGYYPIEDYISEEKLQYIMEQTGKTNEEIEEIFRSKIEPLTNKTQQCLEQKELYKAHRKNLETLSYYRMKKCDFEKVYGIGTYDQCYNVFGTLMNYDRLQELKSIKREREEQERSYQDYKNSNYYENWWNNFNKKYFDENGNFKSSGSSYQNGLSSSYTEQEMKLLKEAFKLLAKKYHPDKNPDKDTTEMMAAINNLKDKIIKG